MDSQLKYVMMETGFTLLKKVIQMSFGFVISLISFNCSMTRKLILPPLENEEIPQILDSNEDSSKSQSDDLQALVTLHRSFHSISFFQKNFYKYNTFLTRIQSSL